METEAELAALQRLIEASHGGATAHLQEIVSGDHRLTAAQVVAMMTGMKVLSLATVTARGEPRISAVDGHFLHGSWTFGTDGRSAKAKHLQTRPAISVAHVDGERCGIFAHGAARRLVPDGPDHAETVRHWTEHYGTDPTGWNDDVRLYRLEPTWLVGYAGQPATP
jgi:general stress protein 26